MRAILQNRSIAYLSLLGFFWLLLASCTQPTESPTPRVIDPALMDRSWLTGVPCEPPCWYGLEPGKSSKTETLARVKELPIVNPERIYHTTAILFEDATDTKGFSGQAIMFGCKEPLVTDCVYMEFGKDILWGLILIPNYDITFRQAVDHLGEPDGFHVRASTPDGKGCYVELLWVDRQLELFYQEQSRSLFCGKDLCDRAREAGNKVPPALPVYHVRILQKNQIEEDDYSAWNGFIEEP